MEQAPLQLHFKMEKAFFVLFPRAFKIHPLSTSGLQYYYYTLVVCL